MTPTEYMDRWLAYTKNMPLYARLWVDDELFYDLWNAMYLDLRFNPGQTLGGVHFKINLRQVSILPKSRYLQTRTECAFGG